MESFAGIAKRYYSVYGGKYIPGYHTRKTFSEKGLNLKIYFILIVQEILQIRYLYQSGFSPKKISQDPRKGLKPMQGFTSFVFKQGGTSLNGNIYNKQDT